MARDLCELVDWLGERTIDLAGYSMEAIVSLIAATREPRLRRLVVVGVGEGILTQGGVDIRAVPNETIAAALEVIVESLGQALEQPAHRWAGLCRRLNHRTHI